MHDNLETRGYESRMMERYTVMALAIASRDPDPDVRHDAREAMFVRLAPVLWDNRNAGSGHTSL